MKPVEPEPATSGASSRESEPKASPSPPKQPVSDEFSLSISELLGSVMPLPMTLVCAAVSYGALWPINTLLACAAYIAGHYTLQYWTARWSARGRPVDWLVGPMRTALVCAFTAAAVYEAGPQGAGWVSLVPSLYVMGFVSRKQLGLNNALMVMTAVVAGWWVGTPLTGIVHAFAALGSLAILSSPIVGRSRELWERALQASTDLELANQELRAQKGQLEILLREAKQAVLAKDRFLANMSHEMRTPLNGILGVVSLLRSSDLRPEQHDLVEIARQSANDLLGEVSDILDLTKLEAGRMQIESEPFNLLGELEKLVAEFRYHPTAADKQFKFEVLGPVPRWVIGDSTRLRQVTRNLLANAFKFTHERGCVQLRLEIFATGEAGRVRARISVEDDGIGIQPEAQERIFERFEQVDASTTRKYGGTGLGLAISRQLVEAMGGAIGMKSEVGRGSTFWVQLELPCANRDLIGPVAEQAAPIALGGRRILLVEDLKINQIVVRRLLEKLGCEVEIAVNGLEALEILGRESFDAVIMDCQMPEMDGFDATRALRQVEARQGGLRTPVIALTAGVLPSDRERCFAAGMDAFLTKPIREGELERALAEVFRTRDPVGGAGPTPRPGPALPA